MTPSDPGSAGELYVSVTGDITALLTALEDTVTAAEKTGEEIASALSSPTSQMNFDFGDKLNEQFAQVTEGAKTAGETFEEFANRMKNAAPPAFAFSEAAQEVIDKQARLGEEWHTATQAFIEIQDAFHNGSASMLDVARAQEEMATAFERANPLEKEASEGFGELAGKLGEFAGKLGIAVGLEEIGREALKAYSHVQDLTTAFTFLSGSAEKANEQVALLKEIGISLAIPMEQLEDSARRMSVSLGGFDKVIPVLKDAADVAALTGKSFDSVASAIERMALSGNAGSRQLVALGIDSARLGEAMETTAANAAKAFKALSDPEQRLEVLHAALAKTGGAAEALAKNLSGSFTTFRNELDDTMEEIGKALEPLASTILKSLSGVLAATRPVVAAMAEIASSSLTQSLDEFTKAADDFGFALSNIPLPEVQSRISSLNDEIKKLTTKDMMAWAVELTTHLNVMLVPLQGVIGGMTAISAAFTLVTGRTKEGDDVLKGFLATLQPIAPKLTEAGESAVGYSKALQDVLDKHTKLTEAVRTAKSALDEAQDLLKKGAISQDEYTAAVNNYQKALVALHPEMKKHADDFKVLDEAVREMAKTPAAMENALNELDKGVNLEGLKTKLQTLLDKIRDLSGVGTKELDIFTSALAGDIDKLNGFAQAGVDAIGKILLAQKKADESVSESKKALDALSASYEKNIPIMGTHVATVQEVNRAIEAYNTALRASGQMLPGFTTAQTDATHGVVNFDTALKSAATSLPMLTVAEGHHSAVVRDAAPLLNTLGTSVLNVDKYLKQQYDSLTSSQRAVADLAEAGAKAGEKWHGFAVSIEESNATITDVNNAMYTTGQVMGDFNKVGEIVVQTFKGIAAGSDLVQTKLGEMVTIIDQYGVHVHSFAEELHAMSSQELRDLQQVADEWSKIDGAAQKASRTLGPQTGSQGQGQLTGNYGAAQVLQMYAAAGALDSTLDQLAAAFGLHQTGNRSYETQQEYQDRLNSIDPSGVGGSALQALKDAGLSASAAAKELANLEAQVGRTGKSLQSLVDQYINSLQAATKNAADTVNTAGASMVTFKQRVDEAGNAIANTGAQATTSWALFSGGSGPGAGGMGIDGLTKNLDDYSTAVALGAASQQAANDAIQRQVEADAAWSASMRAMGDAMATVYAVDAAARETNNAQVAKDKLAGAATEDASRQADFAQQQAKFAAERDARIKADAEARAAAEKKESEAYQARQSEFAAYWEKVRAQEAALDAVIMPGLAKFNQFFQNFTGSLDKANLASTIAGLDKGMLDGKTFDPLAYLKPVDPRNVYGSNAGNFAGVPSNVNPGPFSGQPGVQINITGNAITSQDSAQRLGQTLIGNLRNNAGLKLG